MARLKAWLGKHGIMLALVGIFVALLVSDYFSAQNNRILRDRNARFDRIEAAISERCGRGAE